MTSYKLSVIVGESLSTSLFLYVGMSLTAARARHRRRRDGHVVSLQCNSLRPCTGISQKDARTLRRRRYRRIRYRCRCCSDDVSAAERHKLAPFAAAAAGLLLHQLNESYVSPWSAGGGGDGGGG